MRNKTKISSLFIIYLALFLIGLAFSFIAAMWLPKYAKYFLVENGPVEDLQAALYFLSGAVAAFAALKITTKKAVPLSFFILSFVLFMEEIAWGRKIFYKNHFMIEKVRVDSIHDLVEVSLAIFDKHWAHDKIFIIYEAALFLAIVILVLVEKWKFFMELFSKGKYFFWAAIFASLVLSASIDARVMNLSFLPKGRSVVLEEYFELSAALALFFLCISIFLNVIKEKKTLVKRSEN